MAESGAIEAHSLGTYGVQSRAGVACPVHSPWRANPIHYRSSRGSGSLTSKVATPHLQARYFWRRTVVLTHILLQTIRLAGEASP